jgi:hypothetical protein
MMNITIHYCLEKKISSLFSYLLLLTLPVITTSVCAQPFFPVKMEKKWGLIDAEGQLVLEPVYDAIGEFKRFGYAVMQKEGKVGMLNNKGHELITSRYEDLKVLDSTLIAVMDEGQWMVINLREEVILDKGYSKIKVWNGFYIAFTRDNKWGLVNKFGHELAEPRYDDIQFEEAGFFITRVDEQLGLLSGTGRVILENKAQEVQFYNDSLYFYKVNHLWGAVDFYGLELIPPDYQSFTKISDHYIKLDNQRGNYVYSLACSRIFRHGSYDEFYSFSPRYIIAKQNRQLGLLNWCGNLVLPVAYDEIQAYGSQKFRVKLGGKWGVVAAGGIVLIPFEYDYIAPLKDKVCVVKEGALFGMVNHKGDRVVPSIYHRISRDGETIKAYRSTGTENKEHLTLLQFDDEGVLKDTSNFKQHFQVRIGGKKTLKERRENSENDYLLANFEWFYSPQEDRWGLRKLEDGSIEIPATFTSVHVERSLGFTLVGIPKAREYAFDRTNFRFEMLYGLVSNELGKLVTELDFWDIRLKDFHDGSPAARVSFSDGKQGLIDLRGRILKKDIAYIGDFVNGVAKFSFTGRLSGAITPERPIGKLRSYLNELTTPSVMLDYTQHDQQFQREAYLICQDCEWGYMDTLGQVIVPPQYTFAKDFINNVGIVECNGKWGMVSREAKVLIPCDYDGVQFLENTDNSIVKVYIQEPKYGLVDTLGQLTVSAVYDEIGLFSEGRLAVRRNGMWGFVDRNGLEVIPCRFREVHNFKEGLAAVKLGTGWGFIDKQGNVEIDFTYKKAGNFSSGLSWVANEKGYGYINPAGQFVIPARFDKAYDFQWGIARVVDDNKFGLIDLSGHYILRPRYGDIRPFDQHGLAVVRHGNNTIRYGLIDPSGTLVTKLPFREIYTFHEGLAVVRHKEGYGYIDTTGRMVIPELFSKASAFSDGLAAVQQDGSCGYIDKKGNSIITFNYSKCLDFEDGKAVVYKGLRKAGLIDKKGNELIEPSLNRLLNFQEGRGLVRDGQYRFYYITEEANIYDGYYQKATEFKHGVAVVQVNGKWGVINQKGIEIIPPKYDKIESFEEGYAKVRIHGFNGLASLEGELIVKPDYEYISYAGEGLFRVEKGDELGYFDVAGNWVWAMQR